MGKMNYKSTVLMWPIFLIALSWFSQIAKAAVETLPDEHIPEASVCIQNYIGQSFVKKSFQNTLSPGEYLGDFCREEDMDALDKKVKQDTEGHGEEVKQCLEDLKLGYVYDNFYKKGNKEIEDEEKKEQMQEIGPGEDDSTLPLLKSSTGGDDEMEDDLDEDSQNDEENVSTPVDKKDKPSVPQTQPSQWSPIKETPSKDNKAAASQASQASSSKDQKAPVAQVVSPSKQEQSENLTEDQVPLGEKEFAEVTRFSFGLCFDSKRVDFHQLVAEKDINVTFDCLEKCTTRFFNRIKIILNDGRAKVIDDLEGRIPVLLSKEKAALKKKEKQPQTSTDSDTTNKRKLADTAADQDETTAQPSKKKKVTSTEMRQIIEDFRQNTLIEEMGKSYVLELQRSISKKMSDDQVRKSAPQTQFKTIETLTTTGKEFLKKYSKIYGLVDEYLKEDDVEPSVYPPLEGDSQMPESDNFAEDGEKPETIVDRLENSFFFYKSCAKYDCYMKNKESIPMDVYVDEAARGLDPELVSEQSEKESLRWQKFFQALKGEFSPDGGDDDDSSSSEAEEET